MTPSDPKGTTPPRFSVVLPTHDRPHRLQAAVESVLEQTFTDFELWIVDDGSGSETVDMSRRLAVDPRVRVLRNAPACGAPAARNAGIRAATGDYVAFMDDDCIWHPERLERIHRFIGSRGTVPGYVATQTVACTQGPPVHYTVDPVLPADEPPWRAGTHMIVARRGVLTEIDGFDERLPRAHDWDLAVRLVEHTEWALLAEPLVWAERLEGLSTDPAKLCRASARLLDKYGRKSPVSKRMTVRFHRAFAHKVLLHGHRWEGVRHYWMASRLSPLKMRNWATLLLALSGTRPYRFVTGIVARARGVRAPHAPSGWLGRRLPP